MIDFNGFDEEAHDAYQSSREKAVWIEIGRQLVTEERHANRLRRWNIVLILICVIVYLLGVIR
jgi:t-SNARE complex subunit (syntaxin)